ncbi:MAG: hypothetical protein L3J63_04185 [Geopsychrobacter sp.]|nr:hypothetical protein [Geopsychrobacter sp.]
MIMHISIGSLRLTLSILFMGIERFDFEQACRVKGQVHALQLLMSPRDDGGAFNQVLEAAYSRITNKIKDLSSVGLLTPGAEG